MSAILWTTTLTATATATPEWLGCCGRTRRAGHVRRETLLSSVSRLAAVDATNQETASYHLEDTWWTARTQTLKLPSSGRFLSCS